MKVTYQNKKIRGLGILASTLIKEHHFNKDKRALEDLYYISFELVYRILKFRYWNSTKAERHELASDLAAMIIAKVTKDPLRFTAHDTLYYFVTAIIWRVMKEKRREKQVNRRYAYIEDPETGLPLETEAFSASYGQPDRHLLKQDHLHQFVKEIAGELKIGLRFSGSSTLMLWPMVLCMLEGSDELLNEFKFLDRTALKGVFARCSQKASHRLKEYHARG